MEFAEILVTMTDGSQVTLRRCGVYPDLFASREGDIFQLSLLRPTVNGSNSYIRYRGKGQATRFLVADAWHPNWASKYATLTMRDKTLPLDCSLTNLGFSNDARRGRPRSGDSSEKITAARVAIQCGDIEVAADELGLSPREVLNEILTWFPDAVLDLQGVPEAFRQSKVYNEMRARREAKEAARRREKAKNPPTLQEEAEEEQR